MGAGVVVGSGRLLVGHPSPTVMDAVGVGSIGLSCAGRPGGYSLEEEGEGTSVDSGKSRRGRDMDEERQRC